MSSKERESVYLNEKTCFPSGCIELFLFNEPKVGLKWRIRRELTRKVNLFTDGIRKAMKPTDVRWRIPVDPTIQRHWITNRMRELHRWTRHNRRNWLNKHFFFLSLSLPDRSYIEHRLRRIDWSFRRYSWPHIHKSRNAIDWRPAMSTDTHASETNKRSEEFDSFLTASSRSESKEEMCVYRRSSSSNESMDSVGLEIDKQWKDSFRSSFDREWCIHPWRKKDVLRRNQREVRSRREEESEHHSPTRFKMNSLMIRLSAWQE